MCSRSYYIVLFFFLPHVVVVVFLPKVYWQQPQQEFKHNEQLPVLFIIVQDIFVGNIHSFKKESMQPGNLCDGGSFFTQ